MIDMTKKQLEHTYMQEVSRVYVQNVRIASIGPTYPRRASADTKRNKKKIKARSTRE